MKQYFSILFIFGVLFFCTSCSKNKNNLSALQFGEVKSYTPEFGNKPYNKTLTVSIELNFNQEAIEKQSFIELEWVNANGNKPTNITYFINDRKILGNYIRFNAKDFANTKTVALGLQFVEGIAEGKHNGFLKINKSNLDRVDSFDLNSNAQIEIFRWQARFTKTLHPILKSLIIALFAFVAFHLVWFLLMKPIFYPKFKRGEFEMLVPSYQTIKLKGYKQFHIGGKEKIKQGFISKFYTGKIGRAMRQYDFNITLKPFRRRRNIWCRIKADAALEVEPRRGTLYNFDEINIVTAEKEKIKLVYKNSKNNRRA